MRTDNSMALSCTYGRQDDPPEAFRLYHRLNNIFNPSIFVVYTKEQAFVQVRFLGSSCCLYHPKLSAHQYYVDLYC